ncbi:hypothetical protein A374_02889 [Fictibacillus macauensis ZFHKF-1]|uniref:Squalene cyclase C-terminal domain-containing protein n=1 Tax=Fictibacillus macauensis ZFHKF-1 TaxID=1196324 RepID=I8UJV9_9BACL|nr:hypothetical protein [Fictibacillus macauensis]EIT87165.1 hypothetical protein A374_02889 [Fictibacillus macauensis ZFHKF-1]
MGANFIKEGFKRAIAFIPTSARPLEKARFHYLFAGGSNQEVISALKTYQNEDGGFGHGIEPDFRMPLSSPMATWAAAQLLYECGATAQDHIIQTMKRYLLATIDEETGMWPTVLPQNNEYPHAPWWHWSPDAQAQWMFNPSVELAAYLVHWSKADSSEAEVGWQIIHKAVQSLMKRDTMDFHEVNNYQQFLRIISPHLATFERESPYSLEEVSQKIIRLAKKCVDLNPTTWNEGYKPLPLDFIDRPDHPLCTVFGSLVEENFSFYREQMNTEGVWDISWSWGNGEEDAEQARREWQGILAINRYKKYQAFGYLA